MKSVLKKDMTYITTSVLDLIREKGRSYTEKTLKKFSCPKNPDVETFIRDKAVSFAKTKQAETYLIIGTEESSLDESSSRAASPLMLGYFTLVNKPIAKPSEAPDEETEKILSRFSYDIEGSNTKVMASLLIAQFAKNDAVPDDVKAEFKGSNLMELALNRVRHLHNEMGGCTAYLECTDTPFLIDFYEKQGFFRIGKRYTKDSYLLQYMTILM